jgi:hypothetical protein
MKLKTIGDYDAALQMAFKKAGIKRSILQPQSQKSWEWVRAPDGWTISRNNPTPSNPSSNSNTPTSL